MGKPHFDGYFWLSRKTRIEGESQGGRQGQQLGDDGETVQ